MEGRLVTECAIPDVQLLVGSWEAHLVDLVRSARQDLFLVSPFIRRNPLELIAQIVSERPDNARPDVCIVTNLHETSLLNNSLDVAALADFACQMNCREVVHLPSLHAKVYFADSRAAIVTSANLTVGGLWNNREYGVLLRNRQTVRDLRQDIRDFAALGSVLEWPMLAELTVETQRLREAQAETESTADKKTHANFENLLARTRDMVLHARAKGKTTTGILADTIVYLLGRHGPLSTQLLHPLVQGLHPDICDDSIDRVIDGVHFGKMWKHHVRNAQQQLRRKEKIERLAGGRWALTASERHD